MRNSFTINLILIFLFFTSCGSPIYNKVEKLNFNNSFDNSVNYSLNNNFDTNKINCIIVGKIFDKSNNNYFKNINKPKVVRRAIFGLMSVKNYKYIDLKEIDKIYQNNKKISNQELLKKYDCDAIITGKIAKFETSSFISYSVTTVGIDLELQDKNSTILWAAKHAANNKEGSIPLSTVSLVTGILEASSNSSDEKAFQMVDTVTRRIMKTFPEKKFNLNNEFEDLSITNKSLSFFDRNIEKDFQSNNFKKALLISKKYINLYPKVSKYYFYASKSEFFLKNYSSSIDFALRSIAKGQKNDEVYSILGLSYLKEKNIKLSYASLKKANSLNIENSMTNYNFAVINEIMNNYSISANYYFKTGLISLNEQNYTRLYKALKALKRLSDKNNNAMDKYTELSKKVGKILSEKNQ